MVQLQRNVLLVLLLSMFWVVGCSKKSSDNATPSGPIGTDMGHGTLTFKGKTYYFSGYSVIPNVNLMAAAGTVINDTTVYTLSVNLYPGPKADTTYSVAPNSGALVTLSQTSSTGSHYSKMYFFEASGQTVSYSMPSNKRVFTLANLTETDQYGVAVANGSTMTATLKE